MDKLKGLKVGTSSQDLEGPSAANQSDNHNYHNPLSPETSDVAYGSFGSFAALKGSAPSSSSPLASQQSPVRNPAAQHRPQQSTGMASLDAFARGESVSAPVETNEDKDDLFALPLSPRSEHTKHSPFSFGAEDTMRYMKGERA